MTNPVPEGPPPYDPAHPAVGAVQAWLTTGRFQSPQGDMLIATVRVPNTTLTVVLSKADAQRWISALQREVDGLSSLVIAPSLNGHPGLG